MFALIEDFRSPIIILGGHGDEEESILFGSQVSYHIIARAYRYV